MLGAAPVEAPRIRPDRRAALVAQDSRLCGPLIVGSEGRRAREDLDDQHAQRPPVDAWR